MTQRITPLPHGVTLLMLAGLLVTAPGLAHASFTSSGGGDYSVVPLYRSLVFGGIDRDGDGGFAFEDINGIDYVSNIAPLSPASTTLNLSANGATLTGSGWTASSGFYAARNVASITVDNANANDRYYLVAGQGSATSVRFFTPAAAADHATFTWHVSGVETQPPGVGWTTGRIDFAASTTPGQSWNGLFNGELHGLSAYGAGTYSYTLPTVDLGTAINLYYWSSAFAQVDPGTVAQGSSFTLSANYGNTFYLESVQLYDAGNQAIEQWTLQDLTTGEDAFNQDGRLAPIAPAPAIPEPGSWALLLGGLAAIGGVVRRRLTRQP